MITRLMHRGSLAHKQLIPIVALIVCIVAIGGFAISLLTHVQRANEAQTSSMEFLQQLNSASVAAKAVANDERGFLLTGNNEFLDEIYERRDKIEASLNAAATYAANDAERASLEQIGQEMALWHDALDAEFETYKTDRDAAIEAALNTNRGLRKTYESSISDLAEQKTAAAAELADVSGIVSKSRIMIAGFSLAITVFALALGLQAARHVRDSARNVTESLNRLAEGDVRDFEPRSDSDELGYIHRRVAEVAARWRETLSELTDLAGQLREGSSGLSEVSQSMTASTEQSAKRATVLSTEIGTVSDGVDVAAASAAEMRDSIQKIADNVNAAAAVAGDAVGIAATTGAAVQELGESSAQIGAVVKTITSIAEQTNLLALNATIEAARAGESGKGFAVVANEVKELAQETAKATEDITPRVEAIQAQTQSTIDAIARISTVIENINEYQSTVAAAVADQAHTTEELADGVQNAANSTAAMRSTIAEVARETQEGTRIASSAGDAAHTLEDVSGRITRQVAGFSV